MRPAEVKKREPAAAGRFRIEREVEVISPVFGGGVHVDQDELKRQLKRPDPVTPIRGASVRGQLRFWWRAARGCAAGSVAQMRDAEAAVWGKASVPGEVSLRVEPEGLGPVPLQVFEPQSSSGKWNPRPLPVWWSRRRPR